MDTCCRSEKLQKRDVKKKKQTVKKAMRTLRIGVNDEPRSGSEGDQQNSDESEQGKVSILFFYMLACWQRCVSGL